MIYGCQSPEGRADDAHTLSCQLSTMLLGDLHDDGTTCPIKTKVIQLIKVTAVSNVTRASG